MNRAIAIVAAFVSANLAHSQPYTITAYIDSSVIQHSDYSTLQSVSYVGQDWRWMFDRRIDDWQYASAYLFDIEFDDGITSEIQVNPEFGSVANATPEAYKYAFILGQLPACLRSEVHKVWIHQGTESFGGGFNALLIHVGMSPTYQNLGILEEVLFHEATHSSLDPVHAHAAGWITAQSLDDGFISSYGASDPAVEDLAESFLTWLMVRQCDRRICLTDSLTISQTIPNRLNYFDDQGFALHPICVEMTPLTTNETTKKHLTAYPIPTKDLLTLEVEPSHSGASYSIYNQIGKRVMEGTIEYTKAVIDISRLSDGVYILNIGHGMNQHVKIIKQ